MDEKLRYGVVGKSFNNLLTSPNSRRICGYIEVKDLPSVVREDYEDKQDAEGERCNSKEITSHNSFGLVFEKRFSSYRRWLFVFDHVLFNS